MQIPYRLARLHRSAVSPGTLLAMVFSTFVLSATPFLIDLVADHYAIGLTQASLIGVVQLAGFVSGSWGAGRFLTPSRQVFTATVLGAIAVNAASIVLPPYEVLLALRLLSGTSLGIISWFAWAQAFGRKKEMSEVAVVGPLAGVVASPAIAAIAGGSGLAGVFVLLVCVALVPLAMARSTSAEHAVAEPTARSRAVPVARVLLVSLTVFTLGGSAVFQYVVVIGQDDLGLDPSRIALALSMNAVVAIPAARWKSGRGTPGLWIALTGVCAITMAASGSPVAFSIAIVVWGFAFWMGIPGVFDVLAARSLHPADRAGDAQAVMAAGRVVGPFVGGYTLQNQGAEALGLLGGALMIAAGAAIFGVRVFSPPIEDQASG